MTRLSIPLLFFLLCGSAHSTTRTAATAAYADVATQVAAVVDGDSDVVVIPSGAATWETTLLLPTKAFSIQGAGESSTIITAGAGTTAGRIFEVPSNGTKVNNISALKIIGSSAGSSISVGSNTASNSNLRIHHITFAINVRGIEWQGHNDGGLIDHCTFNCSLDASSQGVTIYGDGSQFLVPGDTSASFPADSAWTKTATFGDSARLFIEDCTWNFDYTNDAAVEGYRGAMFCVRHCTINGTLIGAHGLDSDITGTHSYEIYNNTFTSSYYLGEGPGGIGDNGDFIVGIRSGTGVIHDNTFTVAWAGSHTARKTIGLQCYRATGDDIGYNYALRGTHDGSANASVLSNSLKSYTVDEFKPDTTAKAAAPYTIWNRTDGSIGRTVSNTATTVTATLTGGTDNDWDVGDTYSIASNQGGELTGINPYDGNSAVTTGSGTHDGSGNAAALTDSTKSWTTNQFVSPIQHTIWNRTDGSYGRITANTATTVTAHMIGGTDNDFDVGDSYVITFGYPGLEQVGSTGPVTLNATYSTETLSPLYQWNNILNGSTANTSTTGLFTCDVGPSDDTLLAAEGQVRPFPSDILVEGRDYYDNVAAPSYTAYTYPHPLQGGSTPTTPGAVRISVAQLGRRRQ